MLQNIILSIAFTVLTPAVMVAQENGISIALSSYRLNSPKVTSLNLTCNKGLSGGFERKDSLKKFVNLLNVLEVAYWNHCIRGPYYSRLSGTYIDSINFQYSISSIGFSYTPSLGFSFRVKSLKILPAIGYKSRILLYSHAKVYESGNYWKSNKGYKSSRHNTYRGFDRISVSFSLTRLRNIAVVLEADNVLFTVFDVHDGDYYFTTDSRYNFYNLILRLCYRNI